jgi:hypothetical protein
MREIAKWIEVLFLYINAAMLHTFAGASVERHHRPILALTTPRETSAMPHIAL